MTKISLSATKRKELGRKARNLRKSGKVPANIYGKDVKSVSITVDEKEFRETFKKAGETAIVYLMVEKDERPVLVSNIQTHPATGDILHIDFKQVNLKEKVTAQIPVEVTGESPVEKSGEGTVVLLLQELEVEALPTDLPEKFEIKAEELTQVDQVVKVSGLKIDGTKVEVKEDPEAMVVKVEPPQKEEVIETPVAETPAEGETPVAAEGEAAPAEETKPEESKA
ncbi:MAG TPA: 50S ribosomal protein L25 [Patescibacteria group bacterium]|nr:50S ribosomal protein L25 [Patescibacteria group bacterium]